MAKTVEHTITVSGTTYRLVRDPDTESGTVHYWIESRDSDKTGGGRWSVLHTEPIKTTAQSSTGLPNNVPQRIVAALFESLTGNR